MSVTEPPAVQAAQAESRGNEPNRLVRRFWASRSGGVLVFAALMLPFVIGVVALVLEYGNGLLRRVENQRVADLASYAAAMAYGKAKSEAEMRATALSVAGLNGIAAGDVTIDLVTSPRTPSAKAVNVQLSTPQPLVLSRIISDRLSLNVFAQSFAEVGSVAASPGCILALDASASGVTLSGGTKILAPTCTVSSNAAVAVPCGTQIKTLALNYNSASAPSHPCGGIVSPSGGAATLIKTSTADPLATNASVATAVGRVATVSALKDKLAPTVSAAPDIEFGWDQNTPATKAAAAGCKATWANPKWTVVCSGKTTYNFGTITVGGGISVDFNATGDAATTYNFSGRIHNTGSVMRFGPGTYNIAKGVITGGGTTTSFGAGTYRIGVRHPNCNGARYSICNTSTLSFAGPSVFELSGGIANTGGSALTLGASTTNRFWIGSASNGNAIELGGGSKTYLADALGSGDTFQVKGNIVTGGGGCFMISAAPQHDIAGAFSASGAVVLGAGTYTIDGFLALGANGGGTSDCNGTSISVKGVDVSIVLSGKSTPTSGSCKGHAFCVAAGYSNIQLTAPLTGDMARLVVIGPTTAGNKAGVMFSEGGSGGRLSGALYFPNGPVLMSGGADVSGNKDHCLQIIGSYITLSGGTAAASECISSVVSGASKVSLVQ